jgi:hypothetical protein
MHYNTETLLNREGIIMSCEIIKRIKEEMATSLNFRCAFIDKPECNEPGDCSKVILVVRDKGPGTMETYAVTRYKKDGWGYVPGSGYKYGINMHNWLDQESNGYRVVKWAYLPDLSN